MGTRAAAAPFLLMPPEILEDLSKFKEPGPWVAMAVVFLLAAAFYALAVVMWT